jgi:thiamine biosynthesis protein ThiI
MLLKYGEIALRGKNRQLYEERLLDTVRGRLGREYTVIREQGRFLIRRADEGAFDYDFVTARVKNIFGLVGLCPCVMTEEQCIDNLRALALAYARKHFSGKSTFKVESRRADKRYPLRSQEISASIGEYVLNGMDNMTVNVRNPDAVLYVELRTHAYIYSETISAPGGLPPGASGKGLLLLSGGIDSPVAGYLVAKRGVQLEAVYFHSPPFTSERARDKAADIAEALSVYTDTRLHVIKFTDIQMLIKGKTPPEKLTLLLKRAMLRTAEKAAERRGCQCLVTGDSIGQVASQTLAGICATNSAVSLPVMRPLCGFDKLEIIALAKKIGTYEISIRPYEDCCTLFVPKHPETNPKKSIIERIEANMTGLDALIEQAAMTVEA